MIWYEGLTNQDIDPVDDRAEERDATLRLDAEQETREEVECTPMRIDGALYCCGVCEACNAVTPQ